MCWLINKHKKLRIPYSKNKNLIWTGITNSDLQIISLPLYQLRYRGSIAVTGNAELTTIPNMAKIILQYN